MDIGSHASNPADGELRSETRMIAEMGLTADAVPALSSRGGVASNQRQRQHQRPELEQSRQRLQLAVVWQGQFGMRQVPQRRQHGEVEGVHHGDRHACAAAPQCS